MFARTFTSRARRRGVVLIVVLGMLGLLAVIGFTFATFSNQAQINAKNHMLASAFPDSNELMDYALAQLIDDSYNPQSVIRGHSLKRDMYGNDASTNGYIPPGTMWFTNVTLFTFNNVDYAVGRTNIQNTDSRFYKYPPPSFVGWTIKFAAPDLGPAALSLHGPKQAGTFLVSETHEVMRDFANGITGYRDLWVRLPYHNPNNQTSIRGFTLYPSGNGQSVLPSQAQQPAEANGFVLGIPSTSSSGANYTFSLDSRYRNAFNGAGALTLGYDGGLTGVPALPARSLAEYGNFRYNGNMRDWNAKTVLTRSYAPKLGDPDAVYDDLNNQNPIGMDEDYDACDLENWFLAIQSADGQLMIPSFHRPGILSANAATPGTDNDWTRTYNTSTAAAQLKGIRAMSRILRPRHVDGHSSVSFPDLIPDTNTGKLSYDVDNDGDGSTDSVWLDLGYPSKRNPEGQLFKPLFAFMVIGLNGRLPLNTAGNLNDRDDHSVPTFTHADHLGNSPSEVDLRFALQNAFNKLTDQPDLTAVIKPVPPTLPANSQFDDSNPDLFYPGKNVPITPYPYTPYSSPVVNPYNNLSDKYRKSVADTQLRNILTGTRPYDPSNPGSNGDNNIVMVGGSVKHLPNSFYDAQDNFIFDTTLGTPGVQVVKRLTPPVAGRWGEEDAVPGIVPTTYHPIGDVPAGLPYPIQTNTVAVPPIPAQFAAYNNYIRAGHSIILADPQLQRGNPPVTYDGRDDNNTTFDPFPVLGNATATNFPEAADFYDDAGGMLLPSERIRRFVTPIDTSGDGQVVTHPFNARGGNRGRPVNDGGDPFGRVGFFHYFRPPGVPLPTTHNAPVPGDPYDDVLGPFTAIRGGSGIVYTTVFPAQGVFPAPGSLTLAQSNNPYHGFISYLTPDYPTAAPGIPPRGIYYSAMPTDDGNPTNPIHELNTANPAFPTFSTIINSKGVPTGFPGSLDPPPWSLNNPSSNGMSEADEMDLYTPNRFDAPFGPSDLEWLYRAQDVDGASLYSRLSALAPVSLVWASDSNRRRRLFALDSWELNTYSYANDNPAGAFANNKNYSQYASPSLNQPLFGLNTPSVAQGGHRVNLNFPLPVSNSPVEPIRQKWIRETYTLLKQILPPKAVDTPEELAQLSQYVVNIIDFRDPDCTMTKFVNTDILVTPPSATTQTTLAFSGAVPIFDATILPSNNPLNYLIQYGMEYPPVAINEVLAFQYFAGVTQNTTNPPLPTSPNYKPQMYFELVNTLTKDHINNIPDSSDLDLKGWDVVVMLDDGLGRPDPFTGQIPVQSKALTSRGFDNTKYDDTTLPVPVTPVNGATTVIPALAANAKAAGSEGANYYYVCGNGTAGITGQFTGTAPVTNATIDLTDGVVPVSPGSVGQLQAANYNKFHWLYLRRPLNPFDLSYDPNKPNDNRVVVDSFRFYYTQGNGTAYTQTTPTPPTDIQIVTPSGDTIYSLERMQPYRGGHAVPPLPALTVPNPPVIGSYTNYDPRPALPGPVNANFVLSAYGYSEQASASGKTTTFQGVYKSAGTTGLPTTNGVRTTTPPYNPGINNSLGSRNSNLHGTGTPPLPPDLSWDYLPFNDRDFTSVVELMMVPGTSPGLFTKQFCEQPPPIIGNVPPTPPAAPVPIGKTAWPTVTPFNGNGEPHPNPYLVDEFFYTAANGAPSTTAPISSDGNLPQSATQVSIVSAIAPSTVSHPVWQSYPSFNAIGGPSGAGWHKMLEFFEVPSMAFKAIGPVAQGVNYDWMRQDTRAGQLNLNLIVDEEVFLGVMGPSLYGPVFSANQGVMNSVQTLNLPLNTSSAIGPLYTPVITSMVDDNGAPLLLAPAVPTTVPPTPAKYAMYNMANVGIVDTYVDPNVDPANDPQLTGGYRTDNRMKLCFSDFLKLRHGGSGYLYAWGAGAVGQNGSVSVVGGVTTPVAADRPFRSLSFPDINYTILRPATLPPSLYTTPAYNPIFDTSVTPNVPFNYPDFYNNLFPKYPPQPYVNTNIGSTPSPNTAPYFYTQDPGVRNPYIFTRTDPIQPQPIPARRLFQVPDYWGYNRALDGNRYMVPLPATNPLATGNASSAYNWTGYVASSGGPLPAPVVSAVYYATGDPAVNNQTLAPALSRNVTDLTSAPNYVAAAAIPPTIYLGGNGNATNPDQRDHPYFRTEWLQKVANLTTPRTHQFAVWITVGFFEVTFQGNPALASSPFPTNQKAYDLFGLELGKLEGKNIRYRSFFLLDRTKATGFNPTLPGDFRSVVVYRQLIE